MRPHLRWLGVLFLAVVTLYALLLVQRASGVTPQKMDSAGTHDCASRALSRTILSPGGYVGWRLDCLFVRRSTGGLVFCQEFLFEGRRVVMSRFVPCGSWVVAAEEYLRASWR